MGFMTQYIIKNSNSNWQMTQLTWILLLLIVSVSSQACKPVNDDDCGACPNSYFFDGKCLPCIQARDEFSCQQCSGFYFRQGQCLSCSQLTNPGLCQECRGYFFSDGKCLPCELASPYECTLQCKDYFLKRGSCTHCGLASDELTCKFCPSPFQFKRGKCLQCPKHYTTTLIEYECMSCEGINNALLCSRCTQFYFYNKTCSSCSHATTAMQCSLCPEFYFQGGFCNHCSEAGVKNCESCKGFVLQGNFCVPCRLVSNQTNCQNCLHFRFSTDRQMCVPCQKKGYFLSQNETCESCLAAKTQENCDSCSGFAFDKETKACLNCSQIAVATKCRNCINYYFEKKTLLCMPCSKASMFDCLINCDDYFYSAETKICTPCSLAKRSTDCKDCASKFYWSASGKCLFCSKQDFYPKDNECLPCRNATTLDQCNLCSLYTFSKGKCLPCKYASTIIQCRKCRNQGFFFSDNATCSHCQLASQANCNSQNCPKYGYYNGSCSLSYSINNEKDCVKFSYFSWVQGECDYCKRPSEYYNPNTNDCEKCSSFRSSINCSRCSTYYFNEQKMSCLTCSSAKSQDLCSKCLQFVFVENRRCIPCRNITSESLCAKCSGYFYRKGQCVPCTMALSQVQCDKCQNYTIENSICKRCETVVNMLFCDFSCGPQGYYPSRNAGLCLHCSTAQNESSCSLCRAHTWQPTSQRCLNCSVNELTCQKCNGMYWSSGACRSCPANCNRCAGDGKLCLECNPSYTLVLNNTFCQKICTAKNCRRCSLNSSNVCQECKYDFDLVKRTGSCEINCKVANCLSCHSNSVCQSCQNGYLMSDEGSSCKCSINFCQLCDVKTLQGNSANQSYSVRCKRCALGYSYDSTLKTCNKIDCKIQNCKICLNSTTCQTCIVGWKIDMKRCVPMCNIDRCIKCSSASTCERCQIGYKLIDDKICDPQCNITNCYKCRDLNTCQSCFYGTVMSDDAKKCTLQCLPEQYYKKGKCESCESISNCRKCLIGKNDVVKCRKCKPSFIEIEGQCSSCSFKYPNCASCSKNQTGIVCLNCSFGYSLFDQRCRKCADNCITCSKAGEDDCDTCIKGYVYSKLSTNSIKCIPCLANCMECSELNITKCTSCYPGQFLSNETCKKCQPNCETCNNGSHCTKCQKGYWLSKKGCLKLKPFCKVEVLQQDDDETQCKNCIQGYDFMHNIKKEGTQESRESRRIFTPARKRIASQPFDDTCIKVECSSKGNCKACQPSQYLSQGRCRLCPNISNCITCSANDPSRCQNCSKSYFLENLDGKCYPCVKGCLTCIAKYKCKKAQPGYFLEYDMALPIKCPISCATCQNNYVCGSCLQGYFLYRKKCISNQSLNVSITIKPLNQGWDNLKHEEKNEAVLNNWFFYQGELMKIIDYEDREQMVIVTGFSVGSITFNLIIDKLPTENVEKLAVLLENSLKKESKAVVKVISYKILSNFRSSKKTDNFSIQQSSNSLYFIIGIVILSIVLCILVIIVLKQYLKKRIAPDGENPQRKKEKSEKKQQMQQYPLVELGQSETGEKYCSKQQRNSDNDSDKNTKVELKSEELTENIS